MPWVPLESNPDVMTKYLHLCGVSEMWSISDVFGLDNELLAYTQTPVKAVIFLYPLSDKSEKFQEEESKALAESPTKIPEELYFIKQFVPNACGTIALIHAVANMKDIEITDGFFKTFIEKTRNFSPEERGKLLENDETLSKAHQELAVEGQTSHNPEEPVLLHFIAFVHKNGRLFELDGRKVSPVDHGPTTEDTLLNDAASVVKKFMARDPDDVRFTVLVINPTQF
ncbi:UCHL3 family protein [Megaselia abdita]